MEISSNYQANGDIVNLKVTSKKHIADINSNQIKGNEITDSFKDLFVKAVSEVNNLELNSTDLTNKMTIDPESVNIHDVQIAAEKAEMGVMLTKGIIDRVIRAYNEIINVR